MVAMQTVDAATSIDVAQQLSPSTDQTEARASVSGLSAKDKVFTTYELLEGIMMHVPTKDVFRCAAVSHSFKNVIYSSTFVHARFGFDLDTAKTSKPMNYSDIFPRHDVKIEPLAQWDFDRKVWRIYCWVNGSYFENDDHLWQSWMKLPFGSPMARRFKLEFGWVPRTSAGWWSNATGFHEELVTFAGRMTWGGIVEYARRATGQKDVSGGGVLIDTVMFACVVDSEGRDADDDEIIRAY